MTRAALFDAIRPYAKDRRFTTEDVTAIDALADRWGLARVVTGNLTPSMPLSSEPAWLQYARTQLGTLEAAGDANNSKILGWAAKLGTKVLGMAYNADSVPWCGLFVAHCFRESAPTISLPPVVVRASSWDTFGQDVSPCVGAVLRFQRPGGGHVAFAVGQDATHFHVLGGNQGDKVSIVRIEKSRMVACRAPAGWTGPKVPLPTMNAAGVLASRNEA